MVAEPDFDRMSEVVNDIGRLTTEVELLKGKLEFMESRIALACQNDPKYFKNGKSLPLSSIQALYFYAGFDGELLADRQRLAEAKGELEKAKLVFKLLDGQIGVWRTESANSRT